MPVSPKICVVGSVNLDLIIKTKTLPRAGQTIVNGTHSALPGGKGANIALALKRLGADVNLIAAIGSDNYAAQALRILKKADVDLSQLIIIDNQHTGLAFIGVSDNGENQIAVASGANMFFTGDMLPPINADAIITQFEIPTETILTAMNKFEGFISVNASPVTSGVGPVMERADLIILNKGEYQYYQTDLKSYSGLLAVTKGSNGACLFKNGAQIATASPPKVNVVDTTGAGDSFAAALTLALIENQPAQTALEFACTAGALTTVKLGTQTAAPLRREVNSLLLDTL